MSISARIWDYSDPKSFVSKRRRERAKFILQLIEEIHQSKGRCRIVDIGGEPGYWRAYDKDWLRSRGVRITLVNINPIESSDDLIECQMGDATALPFEAGSFDLAHSNSVIEHVRSWPNMEKFAAETRRVAPRYYVQTPYFGFPIEPHFRFPFFHWMPEQLRASTLMRLQLGGYPVMQSVAGAMKAIEGVKLLDRKQFKHLFPDATHHSERVLGLTKSLMAIR